MAYYFAMPSKVLIHYQEHKPVDNPEGEWLEDFPRNKRLGRALHFRDCAELLRLPYTDEVAA